MSSEHIFQKVCTQTEKNDGTLYKMKKICQTFLCKGEKVASEKKAKDVLSVDVPQENCS